MLASAELFVINFFFDFNSSRNFLKNKLQITNILQDIHVSLHAEWEAFSPSAYLCFGCGLNIGQAIFHKPTRKHL